MSRILQIYGLLRLKISYKLSHLTSGYSLSYQVRQVVLTLRQLLFACWDCLVWKSYWHESVLFWFSKQTRSHSDTKPNEVRPGLCNIPTTFKNCLQLYVSSVHGSFKHLVILGDVTRYFSAKCLYIALLTFLYDYVFLWLSFSEFSFFRLGVCFVDEVYYCLALMCISELLYGNIISIQLYCLILLLMSLGCRLP